MHIAQLILTIAPTLARRVRRYTFQLGGLGLIPLGLLDSSVVPVPGSMDVLTIVLSARKQELWFYYAVMATIGSVIGGFVTYRLARKGGKEALSRRIPPQTLKKAYQIFERWGFGAIVIPSLLPPPMPMVPFLIAAGTMQYSRNKFLAAFTLGRMIRYTLLAYLAARYGRKMISFISVHEHPVALGILAAVIVSAIVMFLIFIGKKQHSARVQ